MNLIINFTEKRGEVELKLQEGPDFIEDPRRKGRRDKKLIDSLTFNFEANLDKMLISGVDKILKRNRINPMSLKTIETAGEVDKFSSAHKIAETFIEAIKASK